MFPIGLENFSEVFSGGNIIFYIVFSLANGLFLFFSSLKCLLSLQQSGYRSRRYLSWLASPDTPYLSRLMILCLLGLLFFFVLNMCFVVVVMETAASYIGFASYVLFVSLYIKSESSINAKVPLKKTWRLIRLSVTFIVLLSMLATRRHQHESVVSG